jgi:hypothetical protein
VSENALIYCVVHLPGRYSLILNYLCYSVGSNLGCCVGTRVLVKWKISGCLLQG